MVAEYLLKLIPNQFRVTKSVTYEVVWIDEFPQDKKQLGECWFEAKQIRINKNQSPTEAFKTYLHECLHAIDFEYPKLKLAHKQVYELERAIFNILKLNGFLK